MAWFPTSASLPLLSTLPRSVASIHSLQDMLTVTTLPPGTPSYKPTLTPGRELKILLIRHSPINMCVICCLVPWPPLLLPSFVFTIICGRGRPVKNGEGLGVFIMWMMSGGQEVDKRWRWGGCRGEGPNHQNNALDNPFKHSSIDLSSKH